jgi:hypothetical protein
MREVRECATPDGMQKVLCGDVEKGKAAAAMRDDEKANLRSLCGAIKIAILEISTVSADSNDLRNPMATHRVSEETAPFKILRCALSNHPSSRNNLPVSSSSST